MTLRILPREDYGRLVGTELEPVAPHLPVTAKVVTVEHDDRIVACWAVYPLVHVEGLWVDPAFRKDPRVGRRLLFGMKQMALGMGAQAVNTAAITPDVVAMLEKVGAVELPGRHFSMRVT